MKNSQTRSRTKNCCYAEKERGKGGGRGLSLSVSFHFPVHRPTIKARSRYVGGGNRVSPLFKLLHFPPPLRVQSRDGKKENGRSENRKRQRRGIEKLVSFRQKFASFRENWERVEEQRSTAE